jgi:hypothetical protein
VSVDGGSLLPRLPVRLRIGLVDCRTDGLKHNIELVVCGVQVLQERLKRRLRRSLDVIANGQEEPMRDIDGLRLR